LSSQNKKRIYLGVLPGKKEKGKKKKKLFYFLLLKIISATPIAAITASISKPGVPPPVPPLPSASISV
jgi:hypothetical protein